MGKFDEELSYNIDISRRTFRVYAMPPMYIGKISLDLPVQTFCEGSNSSLSFLIGSLEDIESGGCLDVLANQSLKRSF